ncbi:hypothetical protein CR513_46920, partial [Mucuna pruriens]
MEENVRQEKVPRVNPTLVQTWHKMKDQILMLCCSWRPQIVNPPITLPVCYKYVLNQLRRKLDDKDTPHILIGYHSIGGYKLYELESGQNWNATSSEAQSRILLEEEELSTTPTVNKDHAPTIRRSSRISQLPLHLRDYELFQDSVVNSKGELVHSTPIVEVEPIEFDKAMIEEK